MVAIQPRFLLLLGLCAVAAALPPTRMNGESETISEHVGRNTGPEAPKTPANLPAGATFSGSRVVRNTPEAPKAPIPAPHLVRNTPEAPKTPANLPAGATVSGSRVVRNTPEVPKAPVPAAVPASHMRNTPQAMNVPVPAAVPAQHPVRNTPEVPKAPIPAAAASAVPVQHMVRKRSSPLTNPSVVTSKLPIGKRDETDLPTAEKDVNVLGALKTITGKRGQSAAPISPSPGAVLSKAPISAPHPRSNADLPEPVEHRPIVRPYARSMDMTTPVEAVEDAMAGPGASGMKQNPGDSTDTTIAQPAAMGNVFTNPAPLAQTDERENQDGSKSSDAALMGTSSGSSGQTLHDHSSKDRNGKTTTDEQVAGGILHGHNESNGRRSEVDDEVVNTSSTPARTTYHEHHETGKRAHH